MHCMNVSGEARHGSHQARAGHGAASERGDRGAAGVCWPAGGALTTEEVTATWTGNVQTIYLHKN